MIPDASEGAARRLRAHGIRVTGPRLSILEAVERDRRHPSAEMIHETVRDRFPSISLSTVYATLEILLSKGLARRIAVPGGKLRIDGTVQDHDHAVCRSCGAIFDIESHLTERSAEPPELPYRLRLENVYIEYQVVCQACSDGRDPRTMDS